MTTTETETETHSTTPIDAPTLISQIHEYYALYLSASPEQLDLLALWTLHTYCLQYFSYSPALNITSRHKQSGKTLCLQLLNDLCFDGWLHTSPSPALVLRQTQAPDPDDPFKSTLLLDDCHINTRLRGILTAGFHWAGTQIVRCKDEDGNLNYERCPTFFPKAFVSSGPLPDSVKDVSITITLEPKTPVLRYQPKGAPGSPCRRYAHEYETRELWVRLLRNLHQWKQANSKSIDPRAPYQPSQFPPEFSSRQQDCAEPLLQVADLIGGDWPQRARNALINIFALSAFEDFVSSRQILSDLRDAFTAKGNPAWISTADLLEHLHTLDNRNWDDWSKGKPLNPKDLAALLKPFGLSPANHRTESGKVIKGYKQEHLSPVWNHHLPPQPCGITPACEEEPPGGKTLVAADLQNPSPDIPTLQTCDEETLGGNNSLAANRQNAQTLIPSCDVLGTVDSSQACLEASAEEPVLSCQAKEPALRYGPKGSQELVPM